jgi:hypothetical protein
MEINSQNVRSSQLRWSWITVSGIWCCWLVNSYRSFGEACCLKHQCVSSALIPENGNRMLILNSGDHLLTQRHIAEDFNLEKLTQWTFLPNLTIVQLVIRTFQLLLYMHVHHRSHNSLTFHLILNYLNTFISLTTFSFQVFLIIAISFKSKSLKQSTPLTFQI